jgi:hypothetical protein
MWYIQSVSIAIISDIVILNGKTNSAVVYTQAHHLNLLDLNNGRKLIIKNIVANILCISGYNVNEKEVSSSNNNADFFHLSKENK